MWFGVVANGQALDMAGQDTSRHDRRLTVPADVSQLGRLREYIASTARDTGADDEIVEQLRLVVSELATNAIQHNAAETVTVALRSDGSSWTLDVSNADDLIDIDVPTLPDPTKLSGRGLFIVDAVMDRADLVEIDGRQHIRCVKHSS